MLQDTEAVTLRFCLWRSNKENAEKNYFYGTPWTHKENEKNLTKSRVHIMTCPVVQDSAKNTNNHGGRSTVLLFQGNDI